MDHALKQHGAGVWDLPPDLQDPDKLAQYIWDLINNEDYSDSKPANDGSGREAYWDAGKGIIVIFDPNGPGSAYEPDGGVDYYNEWPKVGSGPGG